jgi:uncharacterized protein
MLRHIDPSWAVRRSAASPDGRWLAFQREYKQNLDRCHSWSRLDSREESMCLSLKGPWHDYFARMKTMSPSEAESVTVTVEDGVSVSGLLQAPRPARACVVLAHGAGAGMAHPFMAAVAAGLAQRGIASLRYQFPFMERGGKRPDPPKLAHATVRAAVAVASRLLPRVPLLAGGKSFGGRMTSQTQALAPLPGVRGLVFLGFPLHPAGRPSRGRGDHLFGVRIPTLFLQGTRDALAELGELEPLCEALGARAVLQLFRDADHSFHVPARSGQTDPQVRSEMLDVFAAWTDRVICGPG